MVERKRQAGGRGSSALVPGYNHNVKHRGRIFHIQTEDNGPKNPVIITHLFVGGTILATDRLSYEDLLGSEGYEAAVRERMKEQHKVMLRKLVHGELDRLLGFSEPARPAAQGAPAPGSQASSAPEASPKTTTSPFVPSPLSGAPPPSFRHAEVSRPTRAAPPGTPSFGPRLPVSPSAPRVSVPVPPLSRQGAHVSSAAAAAPSRPPTPPAPGGVPGHTMPFLSRDAVASPVIVVGAEPGKAAEPPREGQAPQRRGSPVDAAHSPPDLFGDSLQSDKSLDDVILQYLAEEFMAKDQK
jgi:hypothetical protein